MKRYVLLAALSGLALGCGQSELPATTDPDAIKREQERLRGETNGPGGPKSTGDAKADAIKREQERLKGGP